MSSDSTATTSSSAVHGHHAPQGTVRLAVGAIGVVFGDIGTSPLYALKETFTGHHKLAVDALHVFGIMSLVFWTMTLIVTVKYVLVILRADNRGEGGSLSLLAMISRLSPNNTRARYLTLLGVLATALFFGDCIITPAISVLSAVEGLTVVGPGMDRLVLPISIVILIALFLIQARGSDKVGRLFAPIMLVYFAVISVMGLNQLIANPVILQAINPIWAWRFFMVDPTLGFLALGSVVLSVTGAEALYADMGHFGRRPIQLSWLWFVMPALLLNYFGQSAMLLRAPETVENPFFLMVPEWGRLPLVGLATCATIIASQAVISGAFSVTHQAVQLGFLPRLKITHTSASAAGQIYIPLVNWGLLVMVILLVVSFRNSSALASAYGIAVTGTMIITTLMMAVLVLTVWKWNRWLAYGFVATFLIIDTAYFASNLTKIPDGGWFPLLVGAIAFTFLTTWAKGRSLMQERLRESAMPMEVFIKSAASAATRVAGTAVFMTTAPKGVPPALLHNLKHNKVLHDRIMILTVVVDEVPYVSDEDRIGTHDLGNNFYRIFVRYGFMQEIDIPAVLKKVENCGPKLKMMETSFFLSRQTLLASDRPGMALWREHLFSWMMRNAESAMDFFKLPTNRVVELGSQVEI
ncbi:potassium transporter Kup [Polymorphobacter fuscus]|uniref:Probable potassium transport system protein Kup n=1 Tax=Sandarakinorhabdus fusca TaxID=1439888 RepID=A0A7C9KJ89_9SPHN|nr:potassium transporter Kup [Polymorphobacter fuscus]KAB7645470.1 potassium transporter Kup [Polymorphobacter fuscus]MQT17899.1 potassium transporter Kup [Polymorphobacter fuscus]NJC08528.1 KUP system potassium uptake protein [Polymorphobacter fuscus]